MTVVLQDQTPTAQEILAEASKKLNDAIKEIGPANGFGTLLQELLEVSSKVVEFDEMTSAVNTEATSEEAQAWKEISMVTLHHCRQQLVDRQRSLVEQLHGFSEDGASLYTVKLESTTETKMVKEAQDPIGPPPGLAPPPPGLWAPAGLCHPSGAVPPPPGFQPEKPKSKAQKAKKEVFSKATRQVKQSDNQVVAAGGYGGSAVLNLESYESD